MSTRVSLVLDQGTTFETTIDLNDQAGNPLVTDGMTATSQMRRAPTSINAISFSTSLSNGSLVLSLTAAQTANISPGRYMYDVNLTDNSGSVTRLIEGIATITPAITKA